MRKRPLRHWPPARTKELGVRYCWFATLWVWLLVLACPVMAQSSSSAIYASVEQSVYQIRVINRQSGKKTAIGSGFVVARPDVLVTNYHVVSTYVNSAADDFELEYLATNGKTGKLELLAVDVVHDLAVLKSDEPLGRPLVLGKTPPKGARVYSLGNPMDKGFSIVEGNNNGEMQDSSNRNMLFSGSLNPGMSGGPALNEQQEVVGVNVATSGNGLSYLVPVHYLAVLLERLQLRDFEPDASPLQAVTEQLLAYADEYLGQLQSAPWALLNVGKFRVPGEMEGDTRCWDNSPKPQANELVRLRHTQCSNEHDIYLDDGLEVGSLNYEYFWLEADDGVLPARFYQRYEAFNDSAPPNTPSEQDVTEFACFTDFVLVSGQEFKLTVCRRDYLNYAGLSDLLITAALVGHPRQGMLFNLDLTGTTFANGMAILKRMLGQFQWQP